MERPAVELRILGNTDLSVAGDRTGSFVLRQAKRLALLAYLALDTAGGYRRRDQIVALFWPDLDQPHARTQLRKVLHALRSILGNEAFVSRGEDELRLDAGRVWCDAVAFEALIREEQWMAALELYRGDLLEGLYPGGVGEEFQTWLGDRRNALREQAARAAWECSSRADLDGRRDEAVALARRALDLDPDDEEGVRRLIAVLDRYGDRAGALSLFRQWQTRLQSEYGAEPAPETRKLVRKVGAPRQGESLETPPAARPALDSTAPLDPTVLEAPAASDTKASVPRRPGILMMATAGLAGAAIALTAVELTWVRDDREPAGIALTTATVAVLPLRGLGDSVASHLGEALAEELTTALTQLPEIMVRSTARSKAAMQGAGDIRDVGRELAVATVLDGSVQRAGDRSRVTLRLVRIADAVTVWARAFDLESSDPGDREAVAKTTVMEVEKHLRSAGVP
jgi:DNA-binding SARP family transcriptional activator/TolB-like protein